MLLATCELAPKIKRTVIMICHKMCVLQTILPWSLKIMANRCLFGNELKIEMKEWHYMLGMNTNGISTLKLFGNILFFFFFHFLLPISRESIVFRSNFRNGDFDGFTRFEVS